MPAWDTLALHRLIDDTSDIQMPDLVIDHQSIKDPKDLREQKSRCTAADRKRREHQKQRNAEDPDQVNESSERIVAVEERIAPCDLQQHQDAVKDQNGQRTPTAGLPPRDPDGCSEEEIEKDPDR